MVVRVVAWLAAGLVIGGCGVPLYTPEDFADDGESSGGSATNPADPTTTASDETTGDGWADASSAGDASS